jgi:sialate O-acetylesterase
VESWLSPAALAADPAFVIVGERWAQVLAEYPAKRAEIDEALARWSQGEATARLDSPESRAAWVKKNPKPLVPPGPAHRWTPSGLFNGMVHPLIPYALRGVLWYQGERNAADDHVDEYHALFRAMITDWRRQFAQGDVPFFWVNLPNLEQSEPTGRRWAFLREAQTQTLELPNTAQAVTIDIGDPKNIHPANKQDVAARLVLLARNRVYGLTCTDIGPVFACATAEGSAMRVRFTDASGLYARGKAPQALELAGTDRVFHPAEGRIEDETLIVSCADVPGPVAVRYAWTNAPEANLYNAAGLPAVPFRSDAW